tara:strand:- start:517 stop:1170 length:654 start_codon:yes stop_codon:yes gene_type:complete
MNNKTTKKECKMCVAMSGCGIMTFMFMGLVFHSLLKLHLYDETLCFISEIDTPHQLPTENNRNGWINCDCGKRCQSYTACPKIYVNISEGSDNVLILESTLSDQRSSSICTFNKEICGNQVWELENSMNSAMERMSYYENLKNTSIPIKCYTDENKNEAYLENEVPLSTILLISIPFAIFFAIFMIVIYTTFNEICCCKDIFKTKVHLYDSKLADVV